MFKATAKRARMFLIVLLYALFGGTFSLGKILVGYTQPFFLVGIRMLSAGSILLCYQYFNQKNNLRSIKNNTFLFLQAIIFTTYIPYFLRFWGLRYMTSSKASLLYSFSPFVSYFFSYFLSHEKIKVQKIIGLCIGFFGFLPFLLSSANNAVNSLLGISWPELAIILSVSSLSYGWIIVRKLITEEGYSAEMVNGISMACGGLMALLTSLFFESYTPITDPFHFLTVLIIIVCVSNLICHNLYANLLRKYSPTFLAFAGFLTPLFTALYGWIFFNELISWPFIFSCIFIFIGLAIFYHDEFKEKAIPSA